MAENEERGGFFGFGNQWIWILVIIIIIILIVPGLFGKDGCFGGPGFYKE